MTAPMLRAMATELGREACAAYTQALCLMLPHDPREDEVTVIHRVTVEMATAPGHRLAAILRVARTRCVQRWDRMRGLRREATRSRLRPRLPPAAGGGATLGAGRLVVGPHVEGSRR
jgi:hypothetical protein